MTHGEQFLEATQCKLGREGKDRKTELRKSTEGKKKQESVMSRKSRCRIILQRIERTTDFNPLENLSEFMTETCQDVGLWVALTTWNFNKAMEAES